MPFIVILVLVAALTVSCASIGGSSTEHIGGVKITYITSAPQKHDKKNKNIKIPDKYTVRKGDSIFTIADRYNLDYRDIAKSNNLGGNYVIYTGQVLTIKGKNKRKSSSAAYKKPATTKRIKSVSSDVSNEKKEAFSSVDKNKVAQSPLILSASPSLSKRGWIWPVKGRPDYKKAASRKGIYVYAVPAADIFAVNNGRVIYVGTELKEYGKLILISHAESYLSVYADNGSIYVKVDQDVKQGEKIAAAVNTQGVDSKAKIYFELRKSGTGIDPINILLNK